MTLKIYYDKFAEQIAWIYYEILELELIISLILLLKTFWRR